MLSCLVVVKKVQQIRASSGPGRTSRNINITELPSPRILLKSKKRRTFMGNSLFKINVIKINR